MSAQTQKTEVFGLDDDANVEDLVVINYVMLLGFW